MYTFSILLLALEAVLQSIRGFNNGLQLCYVAEVGLAVSLILFYTDHCCTDWMHPMIMLKKTQLLVSVPSASVWVDLMTSFSVPRAQFLAIEVVRNRKGYNSKHCTK